MASTAPIVHAVHQGDKPAFQRPPLLMLAMASIFLLLIAALLEDMGRLALASAAIGGIGILFLLDRLMAAVLPDIVLPRIVSGAYAIQYFWLAVAAVVGVTVDPAFGLGKLDLADAPLSAALPNLVVPAAACFATVVLAGALRRKASKAKTLRSIWRDAAEPPAGIEYYFIGVAVLQVAFFVWAGTAHTLLAYFVRVMHGTVFFVPLFVGRYARVLKGTLYVWIVAMGIIFVLGFFSGERFDALIQPALCTIGYLTACPPRQRRGALLFAFALAPVLLATSGIMDRVRGQIGRGRDTDGTLISWDRIDRTLGTAEQVMSSDQENSAASAAIWRMISWPSYAATRLSPDTVAYGGWSDFPKQVSYTFFNLALFSGATVQDKIDLGLSASPARFYGYSITETNSYEWGILGDGWYRAGMLGAFLFGFIMSMALAVCECLLPWLKRLSPILPLLLFILWLGVALDVVRSPFLNECRTMLYNTPFLLALVLTLEVFRRVITPRAERVHPMYATRFSAGREKANS